MTQGLDQYSVSGTTPSTGGTSVGGKQMIAQTYVAGVSGNLDKVAISVTCTKGAASLRPRVSIYSVVDGKPGQSLGSTIAPTRDVPLSSPVAFSGSSPQVSGSRYAIVVSYPDATSQDGFRWSGAAASSDTSATCQVGTPSGGGVTWSSQPVVCDFQTYVSVSSDMSLGASTPPLTGALSTSDEEVAGDNVQIQGRGPVQSGSTSG
jgi:hypothetical protein